MAKEKTPRRSLLELPLRAQTSLRYHSAHICAKCCKFRFCARILTQKCEHGRRTQAGVFAICDAPCVCKSSCQQPTHLRGSIYAPQMEDVCLNEQPRRSSLERRDAGRSWRERPSSFSFALSLWNDKERASKAIRAARSSMRDRRRSCKEFKLSPCRAAGTVRAPVGEDEKIRFLHTKRWGPRRIGTPKNYSFVRYFSACKRNISAYLPFCSISSSCEPDSMIAPFSNI